MDWKLACLPLGAALLLTGCATSTPRVGSFVPRTGDEIVVAGRYVHTGTRVVLWTDPGGYDAYRVERHFAPLNEAGWEATAALTNGPSSPNRYNLRTGNLTPEEIERVRNGGWDLPTLQKVVDQFVLHYDVCGVSRTCFNVLHDHRGLSVHFMLDIDGTIYQTLDVKERAWHATTSNTRSVGIEIANMGAYAKVAGTPLEKWYARDAHGRTYIKLSDRLGDGGVWTKNFIGHPAHNEPITGVVQGRTLVQYDFTPEQYQALAHLTAALTTVLPLIKCDYPRDAEGRLINHKLPDEQLEHYQGVLGHFHIQTNKTDPGPAMDWDYVVRTARQLVAPPAPPKQATRLRR